MSKIKTLEQLKIYSDAFVDFETVSDMKYIKIPVQYHDILPNKCICGADMVTNRELTEIMCCDPFCPVKMAHNLDYFITNLGYKNFGIASCTKLYTAIYNDSMFPSFLVAFETPENVLYDVLGMNLANIFIDIKNSIKCTPISFKDSIGALGIPKIGPKAKLFDVINTPKELLSLIANDKIYEFMEAIGMQSPSYHYGMRMFIPSIAYLYKNIVFNITVESDVVVYIAITGEVSVDGNYLTRSKFVEYCCKFTDENNIPLYRFKETVDARKLDWVIADVPSNSRKYQKGKDLGILITANEFIEKIRTRTLK